MTIASALTALNTDIQNARTAITNKGGTVTSGGGSSQLATDIATIPSGSGYSEFPSYQVTSGVASRRSGALTGNEFSDITSVGNWSLWYAFYSHSELIGNLSFPSLTTVGVRGLEYAFYECTGLTSINLSKLTTVGAYGLSQTLRGCSELIGNLNLSKLTTVEEYGLQYAFYNCQKLTTVELSALTTVGNHGLYYAFSYCGFTSVSFTALTTVGSYGLSSVFYTGVYNPALTNVSFPTLTAIDSYGLQSAFYGNKNLTDVYFNALTTSSFGSKTNQFVQMMNSTYGTKTHTLHFPSNLQSTISGLSGYPNFGGASGYVVLAFDLPATS